MKKYMYILLMAVVCMGILGGCGSEKTASPEAAAKNADAFPVGAIYPLSGSNALQGNECLTACELAVQYVNEDGGVLGRPVELTKADAPDPATATTEASRLVDQTGVKVIFGSLSSGNALAIAGVTDKAGVCLVESGGIVDSLTDQGYQYVYRILDKGGMRGAAGVQYIADVLAGKIGKPAADLKVAILHEESSYGTCVADGAEERCNELGLEVVYRDSYATTLTDMSALVLKIREAQPDVLLTVCYVNDAILLVDTLDQLQAMPKIFMGCGAGTTDPNFAMTIGDERADGMFCTDMPTNLPLDIFEPSGLKPVVEKFRADWLAQYPDMANVPIAAEAAFAGAYTFLKEVLPNCSDLDDPQAIREAALSTKLDMTALGFGWDLGEDGQNQAAAANINQWQGGEVVTIAPELMQTGEAINVPLPGADY